MVELDRKIKVAKLVCKVCNERFSTVIHGKVVCPLAIPLGKGYVAES